MRRIVPHVLGQPAQVLRIEHGPSESLGSDEIRVRASCAPIHRDSLLGVSLCPRTPDMATTVSERFGHARREFLERAGRRQHAERREQLSQVIEDFLDHCGAEWAARPAMITRVKFAAAQTLESLAELVRGSALLSASFDEFTLVAEIVYDGEPMPLPDLRPDERAILNDPDGTRQLAGWMLRRNADRVQCRSDGPRQTLIFMFDH